MFEIVSDTFFGLKFFDVFKMLEYFLPFLEAAIQDYYNKNIWINLILIYSAIVDIFSLLITLHINFGTPLNITEILI